MVFAFLGVLCALYGLPRASQIDSELKSKMLAYIRAQFEELPLASDVFAPP
jgi:hypothetical protein